MESAKCLIIYFCKKKCVPQKHSLFSRFGMHSVRGGFGATVSVPRSKCSSSLQIQIGYALKMIRN